MPLPTVVTTKADTSTSDFPKCPKGIYDIWKVEIHPNYVDSANQPYFKDGKLWLNAYAKQADGTFYPPAVFPMNPGQFMAYARSFGITRADLKMTGPGDATQPHVILTALTRINEKMPYPKATVNDGGFINFSNKFNPPAGRYMGRFVAAFRPSREEGNYDFETRSGVKGSYRTLLAEFEIVQDGKGTPTEFEGCTVTKFMSPAFVHQYIVPGGITLVLENAGQRVGYHTVPDHIGRWFFSGDEAGVLMDDFIARVWDVDTWQETVYTLPTVEGDIDGWGFDADNFVLTVGTATFYFDRKTLAPVGDAPVITANTETHNAEYNNAPQFGVDGLPATLSVVNGTLVLAEDLDPPMPMYEMTSTGNTTSGGQEWDRFARLLGGEALENHEWQADPKKSVVGVNEFEKPQYVYIHFASRSKLFPIDVEERDDGKVTFWLTRSYTLEQGSDESEWYVPDAADKQPDTTPLADLLTLIADKEGSDLWTNDPVADNVITWTEKGITWCRQVLDGSGVFAGAQLDVTNQEHKALVTLNTLQIRSLMNSLVRHYTNL
jgi:hypothetical protein